MVGGGRGVVQGPEVAVAPKMDGWISFLTLIYYCEGVDLSEATVQIELLSPLEFTIYCCKKLRPQFEL